MPKTAICYADHVIFKRLANWCFGQSGMTSPAAATPQKSTKIESDDDRFIVYFDGVCGFCNYMVDQLLSRDTRSKLLFAPLQGQTAQEKLPESDLMDVNSLIVTHGTRLYRKSSATVRIMWRLGGPYWITGTMLWLVPKPIRDFFYSVLAKHRYQLFGKMEACRMPKPGESERFLD